MRGVAEKILAVLMAIVGLWLVVDHKDPLPLNHEAIGLGKLHAVHAAVGFAVLAGAFFTWRWSDPQRNAPGRE
jgi:hypothetical protein